MGVRFVRESGEWFFLERENEWISGRSKREERGRTHNLCDQHEDTSDPRSSKAGESRRRKL